MNMMTDAAHVASHEAARAAGVHCGAGCFVAGHVGRVGHHVHGGYLG